MGAFSESYQEFLNRINAFETRRMNLGECFKVNPALAKKVNKDSTFKNFYGDTAVFQIDNAVKNKLAGYVDFLYDCAPKCFCQRLNPQTFHVTLHDLTNGENLKNIEEEVASNADAVKRMAVKKEDIIFRSGYIFNMVNTSLVLGLYPADEQNYIKLMSLYKIFDGVKELGYPLTPHITLAYYNADGFCAEDVKKLESAVNALNGNAQFTVQTQGLCYQQFTSMNDYKDIIRIF